VHLNFYPELLAEVIPELEPSLDTFRQISVE